ncbi:hypothetical protein EVAR_14105_1 [Eumeta japonica]|uniref:Uncharacterized protein n=1 Tax=Eumeta variegata TaxID=151549 RepID=A0A4C1UPZ5_EUMVA|nr:hypothetical protein EVAR_14105_1 [Eumeta japonica]
MQVQYSVSDKLAFANITESTRITRVVLGSDCWIFTSDHLGVIELRGCPKPLNSGQPVALALALLSPVTYVTSGSQIISSDDGRTGVLFSATSQLLLLIHHESSRLAAMASTASPLAAPSARGQRGCTA